MKEFAWQGFVEFRLLDEFLQRIDDALLSKMHWNDSSNFSESDNEAHSAFTQTEHNIVAAYLITAGMGIGKLLCNFLK